MRSIVWKSRPDSDRSNVSLVEYCQQLEVFDGRKSSLELEGVTCDIPINNEN